MPEAGAVQSMMDRLTAVVRPLPVAQVEYSPGVGGRRREGTVSAVGTSGSLMDMWRSASEIITTRNSDNEKGGGKRVGGFMSQPVRWEGEDAGKSWDASGAYVGGKREIKDDSSEYSLLLERYRKVGDSNSLTKINLLVDAVSGAMKHPESEAVFAGLSADERKIVENEVTRRQEAAIRQEDNQGAEAETTGLSPVVAEMYRQWEGFVTTGDGKENPILTAVTDLRERLSNEDNTSIRGRLKSGLEAKVMELKGAVNLPQVVEAYLMAEDVLRQQGMTLSRFAEYYEALNAARNSTNQEGGDEALSLKDKMFSGEALDFEGQTRYQNGLDALLVAFGGQKGEKYTGLKEEADEWNKNSKHRTKKEWPTVPDLNRDVLQTLLLVVSGEYQSENVAQKYGFGPEDQQMLDAVRAMTLKVGETVYGSETTAVVEGLKEASVATLRPVAETRPVAELSTVAQKAIEDARAAYPGRHGGTEMPADYLARVTAAARKRDQDGNWPNA